MFSLQVLCLVCFFLYRHHQYNGLNSSTTQYQFSCLSLSSIIFGSPHLDILFLTHIREYYFIYPSNRTFSFHFRLVDYP
jgi:hypothetical protein